MCNYIMHLTKEQTLKHHDISLPQHTINMPAHADAKGITDIILSDTHHLEGAC